MAMNKENLRHAGHALLRAALGIVLLWFGFTQLKNPASWTRLLPEFTQSLALSANSLIYINGIFEITLAILLLLGLFTRVVSFIVGLHILSIVWVLGYGPVAVRDLGLALAAFSVTLHGPDEYCLDKLLHWTGGTKEF